MLSYLLSSLVVHLVLEQRFKHSLRVSNFTNINWVIFTGFTNTVDTMCYLIH